MQTTRGDAALLPRRQQQQVQHSWQSIVATAVLYTAAAVFVAHVVTSRPSTPPHNASHAAQPVAIAAGTGAHQRTSLVSRGDAFDLYVDAVGHRSTRVAFTNLTFDDVALSRAAPSATLSIDLAACLSAQPHTQRQTGAAEARDAALDVDHNNSSCTVVVRIVCVTHGVSFTRYATLTRTHTTQGGNNSSSNAVARMQTYLLPTLTLSPVLDFATPLTPMHAALVPDVPGAPSLYGPAMYVNNFWLLRKHLRTLADACEPSGMCNVTVLVTPTRAWKVALYEQLDASMQQQVAMGLASESVADEFKSIFLDTNPYLLAVTAVVTVLHMLFEFLALSNDVQFWRNRRDLSGLSLRSIVINCYFQTVIFLYLLDSSEQTSWAILAPAALGVCMEYWKLTQTLTLQLRSHDDDVGSRSRLPRLLQRLTRYRLAFKSTYNTRTRKYDEEAVRWLVYLMLPVLLGYSVYSALYTAHRSWYSYLISTQVQFIYFFGFAMMTPQIFINYKLKSVGQLPWRTFVYKALNTVIDDLFAFVIQMPWLHRLACFRDDVVFVVLLYQRWVYPVDPTRRDGDDDGGGGDDENDNNKNDDARTSTASRKKQQ